MSGVLGTKSSQDKQTDTGQGEQKQLSGGISGMLGTKSDQGKQTGTDQDQKQKSLSSGVGDLLGPKSGQGKQTGSGQGQQEQLSGGIGDLIKQQGQRGDTGQDPSGQKLGGGIDNLFGAKSDEAQQQPLSSGMDSFFPADSSEEDKQPNTRPVIVNGMVCSPPVADKQEWTCEPQNREPGNPPGGGENSNPGVPLEGSNQGSGIKMGTFNLCPNGQPSDTSGNCLPGGGENSNTRVPRGVNNPPGGGVGTEDEDLTEGDKELKCELFGTYCEDPEVIEASGGNPKKQAKVGGGPKQTKIDEDLDKIEEKITRQCDDAENYTDNPHFKLWGNTYPCDDIDREKFGKTVKKEIERQCDDAETYKLLDHTYPCPPVGKEEGNTDICLDEAGDSITCPPDEKKKCRDGEPRDKSVNCPKPPCPNGEPRNASDKCKPDDRKDPPCDGGYPYRVLDGALLIPSPFSLGTLFTSLSDDCQETGKPYCEEHPNDPRCKPDPKPYCEEHPNASRCQEEKNQNNNGGGKVLSFQPPPLEARVLAGGGVCGQTSRNPRLTVGSPEGRADNTSVTVEGRGWTPGETVNIYWGFNTPTYFVKRVDDPDNNGAFTARIIPAPPQGATVYAFDNATCGPEATQAPFPRIDPPITTPNDPQISTTFPPNDSQISTTIDLPIEPIRTPIEPIRTLIEPPVVPPLPLRIEPPIVPPGVPTPDPAVVSPLPLKSGTNNIGVLIGILLATIAAGGLLARRVQGLRGRRATDAGADAVRTFADGRADAKADGGSADGEGTSDPFAVGWVPGKLIRLLIADGHPDVRSELRGVLEGQPDFEVAGEAATGAEAVELTDRLQPRVVLMDLHIPDMEGMAPIAQIKAEHQDSYILVMSTQNSDVDILPALETGATGYLLKDTPPDEFFEAIRAAAQGKPLPAQP